MWDVNKEQKLIFVDEKDADPISVLRFSKYESTTKIESLLHQIDRDDDEEN